MSIFSIARCDRSPTDRTTFTPPSSAAVAAAKIEADFGVPWSC